MRSDEIQGPFVVVVLELMETEQDIIKEAFGLFQTAEEAEEYLFGRDSIVRDQCPMTLNVPISVNSIGYVLTTISQPFTPTAHVQHLNAPTGAKERK